MKETILRNIKNLPGKKTKRKIVVIYVDDYGSIRIKDKATYNNLKSAGLPLDANRFSRYDTLADNEDLSKLFDTLTSVKDSKEHYACFTPLAIVANPDFEKIKASGFTDYHREPFTKTLEGYGSAYNGVFELWQEGIRENIFYPAYHGTEHINVKRFMAALQQGHKSVHLAFKNKSVALPVLPQDVTVSNPTTTFFIEDSAENEQLTKDIKIGTEMFLDLFDFSSKQFTPGAGIYSPFLEKALADCGIKYIHVQRFLAYPMGNGIFSKKFLYNGKENNFHQKYIVRNCQFEPDGKTDNAEANRCLLEIEAAFRWGAPALLSSHRVNFVGQLDKNYRDTNLKQLRYLLKKIVEKWPDVEFMNGDQMAEEIL
ncbi:MAG: polysaccharide (de)acetylase [Crocinitomicaceae bacterium]|nr:polysaccharide (de)acetylase [Crocinitomicaceae bacterium]